MSRNNIISIPKSIKEIVSVTFSDDGYPIFIEGEKVKISSNAFSETWGVKSPIVAPCMPISEISSADLKKVMIGKKKSYGK